MERFVVYLLLFSLSMLSPAMAAGKTIYYKLYWRERNGEIVLSSVCDNYRYGSIAYRGCRAQAKKHFKSKCRTYRLKEENAGGALRERYHLKRQRFCRAASQFGAVN